jgi:nucleotide-binding universal stress UspA family protein
VQPPDGLKAYVYLGQQKEVAIVEVARQVFPLGIGGVVLLISGLISTMSALNATTYSSSRVSFAMGRDRNLPALFARIHPTRHTPHLAVLISGGLMALMAWVLPLEHVAAAADIVFLLLFFQVDLAVIILRRKRPDLERGFRIPWFPAVPVLGMAGLIVLAVLLFTYSPLAWYVAFAWVGVGFLAYRLYFVRREAAERLREILLEEVLVSRQYSILVPVSSCEQARILGRIGAVIAQNRGGEVLALHVVEVPPQLTLGQGRLFLKEGRAYLDEVIQQAKALDVPVHSIIRLGRSRPKAVQQTALENASNLIILGWPGYTNSAGQLFGSVIDPIVDNPPTDVALVRYRRFRPLRSILVPVAGGPNSRRAVQLALDMAVSEPETPVKVILLTVVPQGASTSEYVRAKQAIEQSLNGSAYGSVTQVVTQIVEGASVAETILVQAQDCYLVVIGATAEPLFKNLLVGNIPERVAREASVTVIVVKRRNSRLHAFLRRTVLQPSSAADGMNPLRNRV